MVLVDYIWIFFYMLQYFCPHTLQHREWAFDRYKTDWFWVHVFLYFTWKKGKFIKKKSLYNQPKPYFNFFLLWSHFWIDFNKFYTKTFRIVYILIVYLLIYVLFKLWTNKNHSYKHKWANKQSKYRQFWMFWCKIC
jgi:hypothetical protein